jgi:uncharacterized protein (TIGR03437 family)
VKPIDEVELFQANPEPRACGAQGIMRVARADWRFSMPNGIVCGILIFNSALFSQSVISSGYTAPGPVPVAPGQIATFYVQLASGVSPNIIGITLVQQGSTNTNVPLQSLRTVSECPDNSAVSPPACASLLAVTVQIPYELVPYCPLCARPVSATPPLLIINQGGQPPAAIELNPLADEVHVLTACDVALGAATQPNYTGLPCAPLVTHLDGTLVSASSPANVGEALTAWVFGLGQTNPAASTGQPAEIAAPTETFNLNFNYSINALATKPVQTSPDRILIHPLYAGLAPGYIGLYQVNFTIPPGPQNGIARCALPGSYAPGSNVPQSNLTVSIGGQFSFDGAGICVNTQIPVD